MGEWIRDVLIDQRERTHIWGDIRESRRDANGQSALDQPLDVWAFKMLPKKGRQTYNITSQSRIYESIRRFGTEPIPVRIRSIFGRVSCPSERFGVFSVLVVGGMGQSEGRLKVIRPRLSED